MHAGPTAALVRLRIANACEGTRVMLHQDIEYCGAVDHNIAETGS
jgi:hypothetical protein